MTGYVLTFLIIFITLGIICAVRQLTRNRTSAQSRPRAYITLCYNDDPCFELRFQRLVTSSLFTQFEVKLRILNFVNTDDSTKWLKSLSKKTDVYFDIINVK